MMKNRTVKWGGVALGALLWAASDPVLAAGPEDLADTYFSPRLPPLSPTEKTALGIAKRWEEGGKEAAIAPVPGASGEIRYVFGLQQPSIVCAVLHVCDVALEPGEQVNSVNLGDTARWSVEPAVSGSGALEIQHLIIKPVDVGLETSLVVTTDRRTYHLRLKSHRSQFMPRVSFIYPPDSQAKWSALAAAREQERRSREPALKETEYLQRLSFNYAISGKAGWKPLRVYDDGRRTVIEMPAAFRQTEAPVLQVVRGGTGGKEEPVMVNYRVQENRYIVDAVFDKAVLLAGTGRAQKRVTIARRP